jgi:hypothetical protein
MTQPIPMPSRMIHLPLDKHGRPVPWFVAWIDGQPDFRIIRPGGIDEALMFDRCWLCGGSLGKHVAFVIGPMCAVNRVSSEPGSHRDCAEYAARACPFLANPGMARREITTVDNVPPAGVAIRRNPGVALVWVSRTWSTFPDGLGGRLVNVGDPVSATWFARGRHATRAEVLESIESGMPLLRSAAEADPEPALALADLDRLLAATMRHVPPESPAADASLGPQAESAAPDAGERA